MKPLNERVVSLLKKPNSFYKFKHLLQLTKATKVEMEQAIAEVRKTHANLTFHKFDKTFFFSQTPTWYTQSTDLSREMPKEGVFGSISDTHLGSVADRLDILNEAYDEFKSLGVTHVFHTGDGTDGWTSYSGHGNFVKVHGDQEQAKYFMQNYPRREGMKTLIIAGNHDLDSYKHTKVDRLSLVTHGFWHEGKEYLPRTDIVYLGQYHHTLILPDEVSISLIHPRGNNPYSRSYGQQKASEAMSKESRPDAQLSGHFHVQNYIVLQDTHFMANFGMQDATEFFIRLRMPRSIGFVAVHYQIQNGKFRYFMPRTYSY